jgi:glycosyltransferase involved in cell wall biosynthesis
LDHGQYGVVCDDKHFGTELETLLRDDQRRGLLETQGLERAKTFSWEAIADHHVQWYRRAAVPAALRSEEGQPSPASS